MRGVAVPETVHLQAVGGLCPQGNVLRRASWRMNRRVNVCREVKAVTAGAAGKPSLIRATQWQALDPKPGELPMARVKRE
jgi:hypothetical protein